MIIRAYGYPVAFVAQNGIEKTEIPWDKFECLFIGGDDQFKLGDQAARLIKEARLRGKLVHMGRVNTQQRIRLAEAYGCDSVDGSSFARWPSCLEQHLSTILEVNNRVPLLEVV